MRLLNCFLSVIFIFFLGNGLISIVLLVLHYTFRLADPWAAYTSALFNPFALLAIVVGRASIALAIYDGQFIGSVKPSHWSNRERM